MWHTYTAVCYVDTNKLATVIPIRKLPLPVRLRIRNPQTTICRSDIVFHTCKNMTTRLRNWSPVHGCIQVGARTTHTNRLHVAYEWTKLPRSILPAAAAAKDNCSSASIIHWQHALEQFGCLDTWSVWIDHCMSDSRDCLLSSMRDIIAILTEW